MVAAQDAHPASRRADLALSVPNEPKEERKQFMPPHYVRLRYVIHDWVKVLRTPLSSKWLDDNLSLDRLLSSPLARTGSVTLYVANVNERDGDGGRKEGQYTIWVSMTQVEIVQRWMVEEGVASSFWTQKSFSSKMARPKKALGEVKAVRFDDENALRKFVRGEAQQKADETEDVEIKRKRVKESVEVPKTRLPTPSPSIESSPEPQAKKVKVVKSTTVVLASTPTATPSPPPQVVQRPPNAFDPAACVAELASLRSHYSDAIKNGRAAFLSLDVETWERGHDAILEVGWSLVDFSPSPAGSDEEAIVNRSDHHVIISENAHRRNGRFSPDARDDWDFGPSSRASSPEPSAALLKPGARSSDSLQMGIKNLYALLAATFDHLSEEGKTLYLLFHDPRMDLKALGILGFDEDFARPLPSTGRPGQGGIWVIDTQRVYAGWKGAATRVKLERCCDALDVPTKRLHNAGNDAHYTLELFERLMDPTRKPKVEDVGSGQK